MHAELIRYGLWRQMTKLAQTIMWTPPIGDKGPIYIGPGQLGGGGPTWLDRLMTKAVDLAIAGARGFGRGVKEVVKRLREPSEIRMSDISGHLDPARIIGAESRAWFLPGLRAGGNSPELIKYVEELTRKARAGNFRAAVTLSKLMRAARRAM